jgi:hypothetical protein
LTWEDELLALARERDAAGGSALSQLTIEDPADLLRKLRHYLAQQADRRRLKRTYDGPKLAMVESGRQELVCDEVEFRSESRLSFHIQLSGRRVGMVRIHLNENHGPDPMTVPRCHLHIDSSNPHIPFPTMSCRSILHILCECIEPDLCAPRPEG